MSILSRSFRILPLGSLSAILSTGASRLPTAEKKDMVLKVTSIISRQQRDIAEKEAKLLSKLSHPSIIKMYDTCYRTAPQSKSSRKHSDDSKKDRPQHLILMEYCEGGHALNVMNDLKRQGKRFDIGTLIIAFGQICNAVSYLHAQRPPIVHRDLKPANFLVKGGAYKLCDFGSAVFGHVDLKTPQARSEAEEVIEKTTTQMFRAPEMVDLYSAKKLTQATDVWALGCCLYSMAFLQNCFEEGSNLAILSKKYKIPDDNPYGDGLAELIDRMLTEDVKARSDMTEVILCLSAVYSGRPLPPRKEPKKKDKKNKDDKHSPRRKKAGKSLSAADAAAGMAGLDLDPTDPRKAKEAKKLNPNSVAARRKKSAVSNSGFSDFNQKFEDAQAGGGGDDNGFDSTEGFAAFGDDGAGFNAFANDAGEALDDATAEAFASFSPEMGDDGGRRKAPGRTKSQSTRRPRRKEHGGSGSKEEDEALAAALAIAESQEADGTGVQKIAVRRGPRRGIRRSNSFGDGLRRSRSKSRGRAGRSHKEHDDDSDSDSDSD